MIDNATMSEFAAELLAAGSAAHVLHWRAPALAQHMALGDLYEGLPGLLDNLVEQLQGEVGKLRVGGVPAIDVPEPLELVAHVVALVDVVFGDLPPGAQNTAAEILSLARKTEYKIRELV